MKIVIDIPEGMLDELNTCKFPIQDAYRLCDAIEKGKPLQKGHGRLIDADKMTSELLTIDSNYAFLADWTLQVLDAQPTIIEAEED